MSITQKANIKSPVKHVIRQLAAIDGGAGNYRTPDIVDAEIGSLLLQGYRIVDTHYLGKQLDTRMNVEYFGILYILQLEQTEIEKIKKEYVSNVEKRLETTE